MTDVMLADPSRVVTGGVDTHKEFHVVAVLDRIGSCLGTASFPATTAGYEALLDWMNSHGAIDAVGVEGTGSWGAGLQRHLTSAGVTVVEVSRPNRQHRRRHGKSDPVDAQAAAIAAMNGTHSGTPKSQSGPIESIRVLRQSRQSAVTSRTATMNQLRAVLDTAPSGLRELHADTSGRELISVVTASGSTGDMASPVTASKTVLRQLGDRWLFLNEQIDTLDNQLGELVAATAPNLLNLVGVGTHTAAALLVCAGDNPDRIHSSAAFAALCGACPIPASSGKTHRYRLNRGGNRQANHALWRIAMVRLSHDPQTKTYAARRTSEGLSKKEIIRCLKTYIARQIYPILITDLTNN